MVKEAGLEVKEIAVFDTKENSWHVRLPPDDLLDRFYLSTLLEKPQEK